jgi:surface antigen
MRMGSLTGESEKPEVTGSVATPATGRAAVSGTQVASAGTTDLNNTDWNYARGALGLALTSTSDGPPVPWANPETGARGNFAPSAPAITASGQTCRDFVATRLENGKEVRLNGRACRTADGQWDIAQTNKTTL